LDARRGGSEGLGEFEHVVEHPEGREWRDAQLRGILEGPSVRDVDNKVRARDEVFGKGAMVVVGACVDASR